MRAEVIRLGRDFWGAGRGHVRRASAIPLVLGAIVLAGAVIRLWDLGAKSLWFDEAYSVFMARQPLGEMLKLLATYDNHPPLYYAFLHLWIRLGGDGEVPVRLPSALAGLGAVVPTFLLARRLAGERVALLAAALLAVSPFQVTAGQEARMYPFLTLFGGAASYALWLALNEGARRHWSAYVACVVLAIYTHYLAVLLLLAHGVYVAAFERERLTAWIRWTAAVLLAGLVLLPLLWPQLATATALQAFQKPLHWRGLADLMGLMSFGGGLFGMGTYYQRGTLPLPVQMGLLLPFLGLLLAGLAGLGGARPRAFVTAGWLVPVAALAVVASHGDVFQERYFSPVHPPFVILLAAGVASVTIAPRGFTRFAVWGGVLALLAGLTAASLASVYRDAPSYSWRASARYVEAQAGADDFILYLPAFVGIPFDYYFRGSQERTDMSPRQVLPVARQAAIGTLRLRTSVPPEQMAALARTHPRMWIISSLALGPRVRERIAEALAPYFRQVDERTFGLVSASLWESRLFGVGQRP